MKPNGYFFGEDFACYKPFIENEKLELSKDFFANYLVSFHQYKTDLSEAGFSNILIEDMTKSWSILPKNDINLIKIILKDIQGFITKL